MKKLMTAFAACMIAGLVSAAVESQNIVGYSTLPTTGAYRMGIPAFQNVGGGITHIDDLVDTTQLAAYVDEIQIYDPITGSLASLVWDGTGWTDFSTYTDVVVEPGKGYFMNFSLDTVFAGEVVNGATLSYTHTIPTGYSVVGSAFPAPMVASNFDFATSLTAYVDEVQIYDPLTGSLSSWVWDGTGFTDYSTYLPDQLAPAGEGVLFGNNSGSPITAVETL